MRHKTGKRSLLLFTLATVTMVILSLPGFNSMVQAGELAIPVTGDGESVAPAVMASSFQEPGAVMANFGGLSENGTAAYMGIGTATPERILHLVGNVALFERSVNSAGFIIKRTAANRWVFGVDEPSGFVIKTYPEGSGSTARVVIDTGGRVGINTTSPESLARLHVVNDNTTNNSRAVYGESTAASGNTYGVWGKHSNSGNFGYIGGNSLGVYGKHTGSQNYGSLGDASEGAYGRHNASGNYGILGNASEGVNGTSTLGNGVFGDSNSSYGMYGRSASATGVYGTNTGSGNYGYLGDAGYGVYGKHNASGNYGFLGDNTTGVYGKSASGTGVYGSSASGWAGDFQGSVNINGNLTQVGPANLGPTTVNVTFNAMAPPIPGAVSFMLPGTGPMAPPGSFIVFPPNPMLTPDPIVLNDNTTIYGSLTVIGGLKLFAMDDPTDSTRQIHYVCLEGPEAGNYIRGSAELIDGTVTIQLPDHFAKVTSAKGLTVQLTPTGKWLQLYVAEKDTAHIVVKEATGQSGGFDYMVNGVRTGYEDFRVVRDRVPASGQVSK